MNRTQVTIQALILTSLATASSQPALADRDPNLDNWFHGRKQIQIINSDPIVTDVRSRPAPSRSVVIEVNPLPAEPAPPPLVVRPSRSAPYVTQLATEQPVGFQSNMGSLKPPGALQLPPARSTNRLSGTVLPLPVQPVKQLPQRSMLPSHRQTGEPFASATQTPVAMYKPHSADGGSSTVVKTELTGLIKQHRQLLMH